MGEQNKYSGGKSNTIACSLSRRTNSSRSGSYKRLPNVKVIKEEFMVLDGWRNKKLKDLQFESICW